MVDRLMNALATNKSRLYYVQCEAKAKIYPTIVACQKVDNRLESHLILLGSVVEQYYVSFGALKSIFECV